ncbi:uncharacterized protein JCM6883_003648 [Sporobolomyces salmoneus]|uniref:uncharacterized protein n=1 Tax=Sporobolomyces salmoneus TaxID=183962 RepID=UPI00317149C3
MYSSSSRPHSPTHRLHSRPPTSYRRFLPFSFSSRSFRLHPIFFIPIFLLGTLFSPYTTLSGGGNEMREPVYRREDYDFEPSLVFAKPDAPPLIHDYDEDQDELTRRARGGGQKVLARTEHGEGEDESEWWDPSHSPSSSEDGQGDSSSSSSPFYEFNGLLYFSSTPSTIPSLEEPLPEFPVPKQRPPIAPPVKRLSQQDSAPPSAPHGWLSPGDLFRPLSERRQPSHPPPNSDSSPLKPAQQQQPRRLPLAQRIPSSERDALKRRIGANAAKAQWAKKEGKPFVPGKPEELVAAEREWRKEVERRRKEREDEIFRGKVWEPVPAQPGKAKGEKLGEKELDEEELSDLEVLRAVRELTESERELLSWEEREVIRELERKYPPEEEGNHALEQQKPAAQQQEQRGGGGDKRVPFRDRANANGNGGKKAVFNPLGVPQAQAQGQGRGRGAAVAGRAGMGQRQEQRQEQQQRGRRGGLRKRSLEIVEEEVEGSDVVQEEEEDASTQFVRRAIDSEAEEDSPSLSNSDRSKRSSPSIPDQPHPISYLIQQASSNWDSMVLRQSQTLSQAVEEYTRRYGIRPPIGFDSWWRFAMENRVILVDEYDQIHEDILPFRSLSPSEFRRRSKELQTDKKGPWWKNSFGLGIKNGQVKKFSGGGAEEGGDGRVEDLMDILGEFSEMVPEDLELRFLKGDEPGVVVSGEAKERHLRFAEEGKFLSPAEAQETLEPTGFLPWDSLCPPNSTARRIAQSLPIDHRRPSPRSSLKSYVNLDHDKSMDFCDYPELRPLNGFTSWSGPRPYLLYPLFSFTKTSYHSDLLVPHLSNDFYEEVGRDPTWEGKKENRVLWRGENLGSWFGKGEGWRSSQRARLVALANSPHDEGSQSLIHFTSPSSSDSLRRASFPTTSLTSHYLDIAFSLPPIQCSSSSTDQTCSSLLSDPSLRWDSPSRGGKAMTKEEENQYKYVLDVDGNYVSGKWKRLMSSRSCVLKSTVWKEWWSKRIMPWYQFVFFFLFLRFPFFSLLTQPHHSTSYIPIKPDYSDLLDVSAYFIGQPDRDGLGSHNHHDHDLEAKKIALRGREWANEHFREVDMAAYMFRLYLEYARLLHRDENDPNSMDYYP